MWRALRAVLIIFACFGAACLLSASGARSATHVHTVLIQGFQFQPDSLTIAEGDTVEWKNADIVPHTVTAGDQTFHSPLIQPNHSWKMVASKPGTYSYFCTPHPNMKGKLVITQTTGKGR